MEVIIGLVIGVAIGASGVGGGCASQSAALLHHIIGCSFAWERDCGNLSQACCATRDFICFNGTMGLEA